MPDSDFRMRDDMQALWRSNFPGAGSGQPRTYGGMLGVPVSHEEPLRGIRLQRFEHGVVVSNHEAGLQALLGGLGQHYEAMLRDPASDPGAPVSRVLQPLASLEATHIFTQRGCLAYATTGLPDVIAGPRYWAIDDDVNAHPYNNLRWLSAHNAYQAQIGRVAMSLTQQLANGIRSVELDLHVGEGFMVAHGADDVRHRRPLRQFLDEVAVWLRGEASAPDPITIWVELKEGWEGHSPEELDALIEQALGREAIFGPRELAIMATGDAASWGRPLSHIRHIGWPTRARLKRQIIFVVNGDPDGVSRYGAPRPGPAPLAFLAQDGDLLGRVDDLHDFTRPFYNFAKLLGAWDRLCYKAWFNGGVTRLWVANRLASWNQAVDVYANHVASDDLASLRPQGESITGARRLTDAFFDPHSRRISVGTGRSGLTPVTYLDRPAPERGDALVQGFGALTLPAPVDPGAPERSVPRVSAY